MNLQCCGTQNAARRAKRDTSPAMPAHRGDRPQQRPAPTRIPLPPDRGAADRRGRPAAWRGMRHGALQRHGASASRRPVSRAARAAAHVPEHPDPSGQQIMRGTAPLSRSRLHARNVHAGARTVAIGLRLRAHAATVPTRSTDGRRCRPHHQARPLDLDHDRAPRPSQAGRGAAHGTGPAGPPPVLAALAPSGGGVARAVVHTPGRGAPPHPGRGTTTA